MARGKSKIFGIGLSKTGTTSLANALQILGYRTKDNMGVVRYAKGDLSSLDLDIIEAFDAHTDTPIPSFYRELDAAFPGSKFVLTVRDSEEWLQSCKKQFTQRFAEIQTPAHKQLFIDLYGTDVFDEQRFACGYRKFIEGVRNHFKGRPRDLLIIDIAGGEGWEKLCQFLKRPVPDIPFPKANVTQVRWMRIDEIIAVAEEAGREVMLRHTGERSAGLDANWIRQGDTQGARRLFERAMHALRGEDRVEDAVRAAHNAIARGLLKLNPRIPVLSRAGTIIPHAERKAWNHLWLVDPIDGERAFASGKRDFSVNIALIEDGRAIYGVVYAPATDTIYYGTAGKGAYKRVRGGEPTRLVPMAGHASPTPPGGREQDAATKSAPAASSYALAMCALSEGTASGETKFQPSMEWQTAAADAILSCAGMRVCECESRRELSYNKKDLSNGLVRVQLPAAVHAQ